MATGFDSVYSNPEEDKVPEPEVEKPVDETPEFDEDMAKSIDLELGNQPPEQEAHQEFQDKTNEGSVWDLSEDELDTPPFLRGRKDRR